MKIPLFQVMLLQSTFLKETLPLFAH